MQKIRLACLLPWYVLATSCRRMVRGPRDARWSWHYEIIVDILRRQTRHAARSSTKVALGGR